MENAAEHVLWPVGESNNSLENSNQPARDREENMNQRVRDLAAALWNSAGRDSGKDLDFWLMAESMVRQDLELSPRYSRRRRGTP